MMAKGMITAEQKTMHLSRQYGQQNSGYNLYSRVFFSHYKDCEMVIIKDTLSEKKIYWFVNKIFAAKHSIWFQISRW